MIFMLQIVKKHQYIIYGVLIFLFFYVFYTRIEPIMVSDPDDWTYIGYTRIPVPLWKNWNPAKVMPETLEGILGSVAAFFVYPITGDYISSFTYVFAAVVAIGITLYTLVMTKLTERVITSSKNDAIIASFFCLILHFLVFRQDVGEYNKFLLTASNLNCFCNYILPMLLNAAIAMWLVGNFAMERDADDIIKGIYIDKKNTYRYGLLLLVLYFAVFSNMASNIVLISTCSFIVVARFITHVKAKKEFDIRNNNIFSFVKRNILYCYIFAMEIVNLIYEANGGRAESLDWVGGYNTIQDLKEVYVQRNKLICFLLGMICLIGIILIFISNCKPLKKALIIGYYSLFVTWIYMFLLFARIGNNKIARSENVFTLLFFVLMITCIVVGYLLSKSKAIQCGSVMIVGLLFLYACGGSYEPSDSYYNGDIATCYAVNNNIIDQFVLADKQHMDVFELHIPADGLGYYSFSGERIAATLYKHKIVSSIHHPVLILEDIDYFTNSNTEVE